MKLNNIGIDFDIDQPTPFFQVTEERRVRFGMDEISFQDVKRVIGEVFGQDAAIDVTVLSSYLKGKKYISAKTNLGKWFSIKNWTETIVFNEDDYTGFVFATIRNLDRQEVERYVAAMRQGERGAYIVFYTDDRLLYVSTDVLDIVSPDCRFIRKMKSTFKDGYNRYYEETLNR